VTSATANPSQPFAPTVWIAVALTRGSARFDGVLERRIGREQEVGEEFVDGGPILVTWHRCWGNVVGYGRD
jgi:hypothetical protein